MDAVEEIRKVAGRWLDRANWEDKDTVFQTVHEMVDKVQ